MPTPTPTPTPALALTLSLALGVRQGRYRPTLVNGEPVEVDTAMDVIFSLNIPRPQTPWP